MERETKIQSFEFILFILLQLFEQNNKSNDLSLLKSMKLLFFISVIKSNGSEDLLDIFDNYSALPYGPVEIDVYNAIKNNSLEFFYLNNETTILKSDSIKYSDFTKINEVTKQKILNSIDFLLKENQKIIFLNAFNLVEISHEWFSWKYFFGKAKESNQLRKGIPIEILRKEPHIFDLV